MKIFFMDTGYGDFSLAEVEVEEGKLVYKVKSSTVLRGWIHAGKMIRKSDLGTRVFLDGFEAMKAAYSYLIAWKEERTKEVENVSKIISELSQAFPELGAKNE